MIECIGLNGHEAKGVLEHLAELRCAVFREYPYLYHGDLAYERDYLSHYTHSDDAYLVIAKSGERIVGVSSSIPMLEADPAFQKPFRDAGYDLSKIGYFGESVLLPEFRGHGVGHRFFDLREKWAADHHFDLTTFCAVIRPDDHPKRPADYRPHDAFWTKRGYVRHDDLVATLGWPEITDPTNPADVPHELVFWLKTPTQSFVASI